MNKKSKVTEVKPEKKGIPFIKNLLLTTAILAFVVVVFRENSGYAWVWNNLIVENLKFTSKSGYFSETQKFQAKFGVDAAAIEYIKQKTPENAVILMPPGSVLMSDSASIQFKKDLGGIKARNWTLDMLYPRKLVYFDEKDKNPFANQVTHVVIMDGWGFDFLNYEPENKTNFEVLAIRK